MMAAAQAGRDRADRRRPRQLCVELGIVELSRFAKGEAHGQSAHFVPRRRKFPSGPSARHRRARHRELKRSEEHTSELQSLMRISYAVFCLKKKKKKQ